MLNALALRCRDPGEFIASVVEHHRGFPLPRNEEEKTYLVFIGAEGEEDILQQIPGPDGEFAETQGWRDGDDENEAEGYEEWEEEHWGVGGQNGEEEDGFQPPAVRRARGIPRRIQIRWVEAEDPDEDIDNTYDVKGGYREYGNSDDNESSSDASGYEVFARQSFPSPMTQQGKIARIRTARESGFRKDTVHGYSADDEEEDGEVGPSKAIEEELVRRFSRLPSNLEEGDEGMSDGVGEGNYVVNGENEIGPGKLSSSQELVEQFSQLHPLWGESDEMSDDSNNDNAEKRHDQVIVGSQEDFDRASQGQDEFSGPTGRTREPRHPTANKESLQTLHLPETTLRSGSKSPFPKLHDEASSISSPLSSPPPESEETGSGGSMEEGEEVSSELESEEEHGIDSTNSEKEFDDEIREEREGSVELRGVGDEGYHAVNKISPQVPLRRQFVLRVQEPRSPIRPHPDEISPLTTPPHSPRVNTAEDKSATAEDEYPTEVDEHETPIYPTPTIENLVATENVDIIYLPDLDTLHGFLEFVRSSPALSVPNPPLLAIWGLVGAHYETEYYGGRGIGLTVARAVEAAAKSGRLLVLGEGYTAVDYGDGEEDVQECWADIEVPISNMGSMIVGRTVEVREVLRRWCRFSEDFDYENEEGEEEEEEGGWEGEGEEGEGEEGSEEREVEGNDGEDGEDDDGDTEGTENYEGDSDKDDDDENDGNNDSIDEGKDRYQEKGNKRE